MNKPTIITKYGIFDNLKQQGLSNWPSPEWDATILHGGFYLFDTEKDASKNLKKLISILKRSNCKQLFEYSVCKITTEITVTNHFATVNTITN